MRFSLSLLVLFYALTIQAAGKAFDTIVTDDANLIVTVRDISELREVWQDHPLVLDFADKSITELFGSLFGQGSDDSSEPDFNEVMDEFGVDADELEELFSGQAGLALYNLSELILKEADRPDLAIMANFSASAERLNELMQIQFERNAKAQKKVNPAMEHAMIEEGFMGETLYFDEAFDGEETYIEDGYALVDGIVVLATPEERLRAVVESIKAGSDRPIATSAAYRRVGEESGAIDVKFYLNFESFIPALNEALVDVVMKGGLAMFGVTGRSLEAALALEALQAFSLDLKIDDEAITSQSAIVYREKAGLLSLLTYGEGALPDATFVPKDVLSSSVALFDLSEMFTRLEAMLGVASPSASALMNIQMQQMKANSEIDLRRAVLENFGQEIVTYSVMPEGGSGEDAFVQAEQIYVIEIKDAAALSGALETLKDLVPGARGQIETRDFDGQTIHTFPGFADPDMPDAVTYDFTYVVTRTHLILGVGQSGLIQSVLTAMQSQGPGFWQLKETQALVEQHRKRGAVVSRSYTDFGQVVTAMFESISQASQLAGTGIKLDSLKVPSAEELPWHLLTETREASDGIFTHMILLRKETSE